MSKAVFINYISYYLPEKIVTNADISRIHPEWSVEKISSKVGINVRHWAAAEETAGDLAFRAAENLFQSRNINRDEIDFVILCTQSPDYFLPSTACILQHRLGLPQRCGAFDYNLGCSGYIYGLGLAKGLIQTGQASKILLLTGETYTKYLNPKDKGNKTMFGDAGTATLLSGESDGGDLNYSLGEFCYGTDGSGAENLIVRNGCSKNRVCNGENQYDDEGNFVSNPNDLYMDGKAIFNFTAFKVPELIKETLQKNEKTIDDMDLFIFHQANEFMLNTVRKRCCIPESKFFMDIKDVGNTVSNTLPIALCKAYDHSLLASANKIMLSGFGVGLSMGAVLIEK